MLHGTGCKHTILYVFNNPDRYEKKETQSGWALSKFKNKINLLLKSTLKIKREDKDFNYAQKTKHKSLHQIYTVLYIYDIHSFPLRLSNEALSNVWLIENKEAPFNKN